MSAVSASRVLVIEDTPLIAELVKLTLNHGVFVARDARGLADALPILQTWRPHLVVLNMEPEGSELLRHLRATGDRAGASIAVVALTRRGDLKTKLAAFELGVDDILTIPFSPEELLARTLAVLRRSRHQAVPLIPILRIGELEIDILNRQVRAGASELHLTGLEQSLLYLLAANAGRVITRDEILDTLWGTDFVAESNVVDRHIRSLRIKLQNDWRRPRFIATVPGKGYRFIPTFSEPEPLRASGPRG